MDSTALPSYDEASQPGRTVQRPVTLILAGQSVHALTPDSPALYHLGLGIADLSEITTEVDLAYIDPESGRQRDIYHLRHMRLAPGGWDSLPSDSPRYSMQRASRRIPGLLDLGIKESSFLLRKSALAAVPIDVSGKGNAYGIPTLVKRGDAVFTIKGHEVTDGQGNAVAVMHSQDKEGDSLVVTVALPVVQMHMLVALWCCRVWELGLAKTAKLHGGTDGGELHFDVRLDPC